MDKLQCFEDLVDDVFLMDGFKDVSPYYCMQVCFHVVED
jgi:hypothetical protein